MKETALIIIDMVYDFTDPNGKVYYPDNAKILPKIQDMLQFCRDHEMLIIFLQHRNRKDKIDRKMARMRPNCIEGTGGEAIDPRLPVDPVKDYVIQKRRYSGFFGTDLDLVLRENNIRNLLIVGTKTNCCVRATVQDAYNLDYEPWVISDCVCTNDEVVNEVHLSDIRKYLGHVASSDEIKKMIERNEL